MPSVPIPAETNIPAPAETNVSAPTETENGEKKETTEEDASKKKEGDYTMLGNATLTPCGPGVISQVLDDGRAVVILLASWVFSLHLILVREVVT